jgi:hypothetical protein
VAVPHVGAATRIGGIDRLGHATKDPWLAWAALVVPAFATALSWRLTGGLPWIDRVAIGVAAALAVYGVLVVFVRGFPRR